MIKQGMTRETLVIEGYVSLFGVEDLTGDVVRAGALRGHWRAAAGCGCC